MKACKAYLHVSQRSRIIISFGEILALEKETGKLGLEMIEGKQ